MWVRSWWYIDSMFTMEVFQNSTRSNCLVHGRNSRPHILTISTSLSLSTRIIPVCFHSFTLNSCSFNIHFYACSQNDTPWNIWSMDKISKCCIMKIPSVVVIFSDGWKGYYERLVMKYVFLCHKCQFVGYSSCPLYSILLPNPGSVQWCHQEEHYSFQSEPLSPNCLLSLNWSDLTNTCVCLFLVFIHNLAFTCLF